MMLAGLLMPPLRVGMTRRAFLHYSGEAILLHLKRAVVLAGFPEGADLPGRNSKWGMYRQIRKPQNSLSGRLAGLMKSGDKSKGGALIRAFVEVAGLHTTWINRGE